MSREVNRDFQSCVYAAAKRCTVAALAPVVVYVTPVVSGVRGTNF